MELYKRNRGQSINSVEEALRHAIERAHSWRSDAILTQITLISTEKKDIQDKSGKVNFRFEFPYSSDSEPSGIMYVIVNLNNNSIDFLEAIHGYSEHNDIKGLKLDDYPLQAKELYQIAFNENRRRKHICLCTASSQIVPSSNR